MFSHSRLRARKLCELGYSPIVFVMFSYILAHATISKLEVIIWSFTSQVSLAVIKFACFFLTSSSCSPPFAITHDCHARAC